MIERPWLAIALYVACIAALFAGLACYIGWLARVAPAPERSRVMGTEAEARFKSLSGRVKLFALLLWLVSMGPAFLVARLLAQWRLAHMPAAEMTVTAADTSMLMIVAMFAGMAIAMTVFARLIRRLWRADGSFFLDCLSVKYGCDYGRLCRGVALPFWLLSAVLLLLGMNCYVQTRPGVLAVHPFFALGEKAYRYSDIERILTAVVVLPAHNYAYYGRDYWLVFRDGRVWDLYRELPAGDAATRKRLAEVIARHAGLAIEPRLP